MRSNIDITVRRIFANTLDTAIEISGGVLGSYFGMMVAALLESAKDTPGEQLQSSMWSGFGFGFLFWMLSISFINRVLIQGLSRASIGKKIFKLELISTDAPLSWGTILGRWTMGFGSFFLLGSGYLYAFFDKDGRTFHDIAAQTDVVPLFKGTSMSVEYQETNVVAFPSYVNNLRNTVILAQNTAERPTATVTHLPVIPKVTSIRAEKTTAEPNNLAEVVKISDRGDGEEAA